MFEESALAVCLAGFRCASDFHVSSRASLLFGDEGPASGVRVKNAVSVTQLSPDHKGREPKLKKIRTSFRRNFRRASRLRPVNETPLSLEYENGNITQKGIGAGIYQ